MLATRGQSVVNCYSFSACSQSTPVALPYIIFFLFFVYSSDSQPIPHCPRSFAPYPHSPPLIHSLSPTVPGLFTSYSSLSSSNQAPFLHLFQSLSFLHCVCSLYYFPPYFQSFWFTIRLLYVPFKAFDFSFPSPVTFKPPMNLFSLLFSSIFSLSYSPSVS